MVDYANSKCRITGKFCTAWSEITGCGLVRCKFIERKGGDKGMTDSRKDCQMRHENGNCTVAGGFCTAVNDTICEALHNAFDCGYRSALRSKQERNDWICTLKCMALMDEGICSHGGLCCLHESQRNIKENEPLTLDELRMMDGEPVWIVEDPDWGHWELSVDAEDYLADRYEFFYGMKHDDPDGRYGLHKLGWLAYRQKPEEDDHA